MDAQGELLAASLRQKQTALPKSDSPQQINADFAAAKAINSQLGEKEMGLNENAGAVVSKLESQDPLDKVSSKFERAEGFVAVQRVLHDELPPLGYDRMEAAVDRHVQKSPEQKPPQGALYALFVEAFKEGPAALAKLREKIKDYAGPDNFIDPLNDAAAKLANFIRDQATPSYDPVSHPTPPLSPRQILEIALKDEAHSNRDPAAVGQEFDFPQLMPANVAAMRVEDRKKLATFYEALSDVDREALEARLKAGGKMLNTNPSEHLVRGFDFPGTELWTLPTGLEQGFSDFYGKPKDMPRVEHDETLGQLNSTMTRETLPEVRRALNGLEVEAEHLGRLGRAAETLANSQSTAADIYNAIATLRTPTSPEEAQIRPAFGLIATPKHAISWLESLNTEQLVGLGISQTEKDQILNFKPQEIAGYGNLASEPGTDMQLFAPESDSPLMPVLKKPAARASLVEYMRENYEQSAGHMAEVYGPLLLTPIDSAGGPTRIIDHLKVEPSPASTSVK